MIRESERGLTPEKWRAVFRGQFDALVKAELNAAAALA